ncbi:MULTISPECIES: hypothetical protein [unclassified Bradyrhizobium]|uniref:hypothetical protein n=1 Tax=unclassified Bradyrhizobium TaxID=2631580 RepID=UPI0029170162|nr:MULTISPECIES: hypothetical protein [unclassified Bradyrhizobium]
MSLTVRGLSRVAAVGCAQQRVLAAFTAFLVAPSKERRRALDYALCQHDDLLDSMLCDWTGYGPTLYEGEQA